MYFDPDPLVTQSKFERRINIFDNSKLLSQ